MPGQCFRGATLLELLDNFFRFGAIVGCLFTSALVIRDVGRRTCAGRHAAFCCFTTAAYLLACMPGLGDIMGAGMIPVLLICLFGPTAVWVFCLSMFEDNFCMTRKHIAVMVTFYVLGVIQYVNYYLVFGELPLVSPTRIVVELMDAGTIPWLASLTMLAIKLGLALHILWVAWNGRRDDLVLKRRHFREVFVVTVAIISFGIVITENWLLGFAPETAYLLLVGQSASIFLVSLYMLWHITSIDGEWLFGDYRSVEAVPVTRSECEDRHDLETLDGLAASGTLMASGMTISKLAQMAGMPEHRLRRLVNQHLGYRNFADYLNFHRIEEAKSRLSTVADRHVPVLTVAMDLGYGSLGPFNRAFKERSGMTPTAFRRKALDMI